MQFLLELIFWSALGLILYTYLLYPLIMLLLATVRTLYTSLRFLLTREGRRISDRTSFSEEEWPFVSLILAARNEAEVILAKVKNFQELDYPPDKLELLVGSDASDDETVPLLREAGDSRVVVFDYQERSGKIGVLKKLVKESRGEIILLSDANTYFQPQALRKIIRHFGSQEVGAVCGELRLMAPDGSLQSEGTYWRYETGLKTLESGFNCVLGANGGNYAVRRDLFPEIPPDTIVEDLVIPLKIREKGYQTPFEPEAVALEKNPVDPAGEARRRVRIGAGCAQAVPMLLPLLSPRFGMTAFALWSHKILRWLVPFAMPAALLTNLLLLSRPFLVFVFLLQLLFYGCAVVGWVREKQDQPQGVFGLAYLFVILNFSLARGYLQYARGQHRVTWERTKRVGAP